MQLTDGDDVEEQNKLMNLGKRIPSQLVAGGRTVRVVSPRGQASLFEDEDDLQQPLLEPHPRAGSSVGLDVCESEGELSDRSSAAPSMRALGRSTIAADSFRQYV